MTPGPGGSFEAAPSPVRPVEAPKGPQPETQANILSKARERLSSLFGRRQAIKQDIEQRLGNKALTDEANITQPTGETSTSPSAQRTEKEEVQIGNLTVNHDTTPIHVPAADAPTISQQQEATQTNINEVANAEPTRPEIDLSKPLRYPNGKEFTTDDAIRTRKNRYASEFEKDLLQQHDQREAYRNEPVLWPDGRVFTSGNAAFFEKDFNDGYTLSDTERSLVNEYRKKHGEPPLLEHPPKNTGPGYQNLENLPKTNETTETVDVNPQTKPESIELTPEEQKVLDDLRAKYPDNPLLNNNFEEVPDGYMSVYRLISERGLVRCGENGLDATSDPEIAKRRLKRDGLFDNFAPEGINRSSSVFAYPALENIITADTSSDSADATANVLARKGSNIICEVKVDPKKARVVSMTSYDFTKDSLMGDTPEEQFENVKDYLQEYWDESVTLEVYLSLDETERAKFGVPEVLIPGHIDQKMMKVIGINLPKNSNEE